MKTDVKGFAIYKPTKSNKGAALQFNPDSSLKCVWMEMAPQTGHQQFDWDNKIVFKLGNSDLLSMIWAMQIVKDSKYKAFLIDEKSDKDSTLYTDFCDALVDPKDGTFCNLFHSDKKGSQSRLKITPNGAQYGGGFRFSLFKKFEDGDTLSHGISITPAEALGVLMILEKPLTVMYVDREE
jgi:hypothetical protein